MIADVGDGLHISAQQSWDIMRDSSVSLDPSSNIQLMQYIPDEGILSLSVYKNGQPAFMNAPATWLLSDLLTHPAGIDIEPAVLSLSLWPVPAKESIRINFFSQKTGTCRVRIISLGGKVMLTNKSSLASGGMQHISIDTGKFLPGVYIIHLESPEGSASGRFIIVN